MSHIIVICNLQLPTQWSIIIYPTRKIDCQFQKFTMKQFKTHFDYESQSNGFAGTLYINFKSKPWQNKKSRSLIVMLSKLYSFLICHLQIVMLSKLYISLFNLPSTKKDYYFVSITTNGWHFLFCHSFRLLFALSKNICLLFCDLVAWKSISIFRKY